MSNNLKRWTINGREANGYDLLMLWQAVNTGTARLVYAKNGSLFVNFITR